MQMKKMNKHKILKFLGQALMIILFHLGGIAMFVFGFLQNTIY